MMTLDADTCDVALAGRGGDRTPADVFEDVLTELRRVLRLGRAVSHRQLATFDGVAPALFHVLVVLSRGGPMRTTAIAEQLRVDVSVASRQVGELEHLGLVDRQRDPADARAVLVAVTPTGADTVQHVRHRQLALTRSALSGWDTEELQIFVAGLRRFSDDMIRGAFDDAAPTHDRQGEDPA